MKNLLSISLLTIYLFGNTELNQLFDVPALVDHYKQHHSENRKINFINFLVMHYCTDDGITTDDMQDNKLPFKQIHRFGFVFFTTPVAERFSVKRKFGSDFEMCNRPFIAQCVKPVYLSKLKHPPRLLS